MKTAQCFLLLSDLKVTDNYVTIWAGYLPGDNSLPTFRKILMTALCCLMLAGCATQEEDDIAVTNEPDIDMTYQEMAREMSNGSVQIYSLDDPGVPVAPLAPPEPFASAAPMLQDGGMPSSADQNVIVYPFDDHGVYPQEYRPPLAPPSGGYRPLASPFGGPLQSPAPLLAPPLVQPPEALSYPEERGHSDASRIYFRHGSSSLNEPAHHVIDHVSRSGGAVVVAGHASERAETSDPVERSIVNLKMSMDRAFKVSSQLIREGVPAEAIETRAYGATRPAPPIPGAEPEQASRRVEILVDGAYAPVASAPAVEDAPIPPLAPY